VCAAICLGGFAQWITRDYAELPGIRAERERLSAQAEPACGPLRRGGVSSSVDDNDPELWRSEGTSAGSKLVDEFVPGADADFSGPLVNIGGTLYFGARDLVNGCRALDATETPPGAAPLPGRVAACRLHGHAQGRL
jgi:ELWxxDGT repeat protein